MESGNVVWLQVERMNWVRSRLAGSKTSCQQLQKIMSQLLLCRNCLIGYFNDLVLLLVGMSDHVLEPVINYSQLCE